MSFADQEMAVGQTADYHADMARAMLARDEAREATVHALLAIEARLNELAYRLAALDPKVGRT